MFKALEEHITLIEFDPNNQRLDSILEIVKDKIYIETNKEAFKQKRENEGKALMALFGVGLGLLALAAFNK